MSCDLMVITVKSIGNYEVLRFEFSSPPNPLLSSARDVNRSPVQLSSKSSGIKSYITRDSLFDANNHLVDNNKITIACEVCLQTSYYHRFQ
jgi:hypothetical protein